MDPNLGSIRAVVAIVCLGGAWGLAACDSPAPPGAPSPTPTSAPRPASPTSFTVTGPAAIAPGGSGQFQALLTSSDGTTTDVTSTAEWIVNDRRILQLTGPGTFVGRERGESWVKARFNRIDWDFRIRVLEDGTFKFSGRVVERFAGHDVGVNATLEVLEGTGAGMREGTADGWFNFFGVAGTIRVRVTADGYGTEEFGQVVGDGASRAVVLVPRAGPLNLAGQWVLSTIVGTECQLRDDLRSREIPLDIQHAGSTFFEARAVGPNIAQAKPLAGQIDGQSITLSMPFSRPQDYDWPAGGVADYSVVQIDPVLGRVGIGGKVRLSLDGASASGEFDSGFDVQGPTSLLGFVTPCDTRGPATLRRR